MMISTIRAALAEGITALAALISPHSPREKATPSSESTPPVREVQVTKPALVDLLREHPLDRAQAFANHAGSEITVWIGDELVTVSPEGQVWRGRGLRPEEEMKAAGARAPKGA